MKKNSLIYLVIIRFLFSYNNVFNTIAWFRDFVINNTDNSGDYYWIDAYMRYSSGTQNRGDEPFSFKINHFRKIFLNQIETPDNSLTFQYRTQILYT